MNTRSRLVVAGWICISALMVTASANEQASDAQSTEARSAARAEEVTEQGDKIYDEKGQEEWKRFMLAKAEKLITEFPDQPHAYRLLVGVAFGSNDGDAKPLFERVAAAPSASAAQRSLAEGQLRRMEMIDKPLGLNFTALDGGTFDVAAQKGRVVVIDWWATWCPPCIKELPRFKQVVKEFGPKGVVFVGISLDSDKDKLTAFLEKEQMNWPQYFDGLQWKNVLSVQFDVRSIPAVWLVDKKGVLRDTNGSTGLEEKLTHLLEE